MFQRNSPSPNHALQRTGAAVAELGVVRRLRTSSNPRQMNFFYTDADGTVIGPVTRDQLQQFSEAGLLPEASQACYEGSEEWQPVSQFVRPTKKPKPMPAPSKPAASVKSAPIAPATASPDSHSMTRNQGSFIIALLCIGLGLPFWSFSRPIPRFEYLVAAPGDTLFEVEMNALGKQGWEIVSARRATSGSEYSRSASYEVILNRPIR